MPQKIYLAGPEVFLPDCIELGRAKKALCEKHGFVGLFPLDNEIVNLPSEERLDRAIYAANLVLMREADIGICNLTPFRGISADTGTVFELGMMLGQGKPVFGYTNHCDDLLSRTRAASTVIPKEKGYFDEQGLFIEDFGNSDNLMIDASLALAGHPIIKPLGPIADMHRDLQGFEKCLVLARAEAASL